MARTRDIRTNQQDISCDVCGRTLLRGERAEPFLAGGSRRQVCELCTARAQHEGWIRESGADELTLRSSRHEGRTRLVDRLRARRERAREVADAAGRAGGRRGRACTSTRPPASARAPEPPPPEPPRQPAPRARGADERRAQDGARARRLQRAPTTCAPSAASRARSAPPAVCVRPLADRPSVVAITVMWELSWYRFEVDLSDEGSGVRREGHGAELAELAPEEQVVNAAADERGGLHLAAPRRDSTDDRVSAAGRRVASRTVIYCVVPEPLADELYPRLAGYYEADPNVTVIVDRRKSERREPGATGGGQREVRDRRRPRVAGEFPPIAASSNGS